MSSSPSCESNTAVTPIGHDDQATGDTESAPAYGDIAQAPSLHVGRKDRPSVCPLPRGRRRLPAPMVARLHAAIQASVNGTIAYLERQGRHPDGGSTV